MLTIHGDDDDDDDDYDDYDDDDDDDDDPCPLDVLISFLEVT